MSELHGYICECSDTKCQVRVRITHAEFLRRAALGPVMAVGHTAAVPAGVRSATRRYSPRKGTRRGGGGVRAW